jgi:hypothetical protein
VDRGKNLFSFYLRSQFWASRLAVESRVKPAYPAQQKEMGRRQPLLPGLQNWDIKVGSGATAVPGSVVKVRYTGWLSTGEKFDSSLDRGEGSQKSRGYDYTGANSELSVPVTCCDWLRH